MAADDETLARLAGGELRELLGMIEGTDIEELELEVGGTRLYFRRPSSGRPLAPPSADDLSVDGLGSRETAIVVAERVGFFHYSGDGVKDGLRPGDRVALGQVLGVIDSLNVPNPVPAPRSGSLEEVLVEEGQPVEFGQPLFVIAPGED